MCPRAQHRLLKCLRGGAKCDADQEAARPGVVHKTLSSALQPEPSEAYEVACMELAAFLAWLIAQALRGCSAN